MKEDNRIVFMKDRDIMNVYAIYDIRVTCKDFQIYERNNTDVVDLFLSNLFGTDVLLFNSIVLRMLKYKCGNLFNISGHFSNENAVLIHKFVEMYFQINNFICNDVYPIIFRLLLINLINTTKSHNQNTFILEISRGI